MKQVCFGVDIGGTTVKLGLVSQEGDLLEKREFPSSRDQGATFDDIASNIRQVMDSFPFPLGTRSCWPQLGHLK